MELGNQLIDPGEFRTRVLLQNSTLTTDPGGAQKATWSDLATVWSKWINAHGPETVTSEALKTVKRATAMIRFQSGVTERTSIVKDGERWQVISMDDIENRHEYISLVIELAKGSV